MADTTLAGCRVLVVEDEYMLADDLATELGDAGAIVLGPVGTLAEAIGAIETEQRIDGAILDVNLRGEAVFDAAHLLSVRGVPFVFTTGYDGSAIPAPYEHIPRCEKPINMRHVAHALGRAIRR